ncbi:unnamed protein product [Lathyrus sativus]|nr:unnamed protein product [Lathyrus sativus]
MEDGIAHSIWRNTDLDFSALNSSRRSGGILTLWNRSKVLAISSFCGTGFLGIHFLWNNQSLIGVNVYAPYSSADRRNLWRDLTKIKSKLTGVGWIVGGDFNEVKIGEERKGLSANSLRNMKVFSEFIDELKLTDLPVFGNKFTWFNSNGKSRSRLDRFLADDLAISMLSLINQVVGDRDVSDHRPVWLKSNFVNWGPKPFRSFNYWFSHKDFIPFVKQSWNSYHASGSFCNILIKKFTALKSDLWSWNRNVFDWLDLKEFVSNLNTLEMDSDLVFASHNEDLNKERYRSNCLSAIGVGDGMEEDPEAIKCEAVKYFKERYQSQSSPKLFIYFNNIACFEEEDRLRLETVFCPAEVKDAVFSCDGNTCPSADGFKTNYSKSCLYGIRLDPDFLVAAEDFLHCKFGKLSFRFFGITVGGNHRRYSFRNPVLNCLRNKLSN